MSPEQEQFAKNITLFFRDMADLFMVKAHALHSCHQRAYQWEVRAHLPGASDYAIIMAMKQADLEDCAYNELTDLGLDMDQIFQLIDLI